MKDRPNNYPRQSRVRKRADYLACYQNGERFHSTHFLLFRQDSACGQRFGIAASRKAGNAVQRNRLKRLLREFFRLHKRDAPDSIIVAAAKKGAGMAVSGLAEVTSELLPVLRRMRKLRA